jgi:hypothetical protein
VAQGYSDAWLCSPLFHVGGVASEKCGGGDGGGALNYSGVD